MVCDDERTNQILAGIYHKGQAHTWDGKAIRKVIGAKKTWALRE
jgi:uncharacterized protein (UPF0335 family)